MSALARIVWAAAAFLVACGGSTGAPAGPGGTGATCAEVGRRLVVLAIIDNGLAADMATADGIADAPPADLHGVEAEFRAQCERDRWSAARRDCLAAAQAQEGTLSCSER